MIFSEGQKKIVGEDCLERGTLRAFRFKGEGGGGLDGTWKKREMFCF